MKANSVAILGAGSWGTAIAIHLATFNNKVFLWSKRPDHVARMRLEHCNGDYLPTIPFPSNLIPEDNLSVCVENSEIIIIAVPSHAFAEVIAQIPKPPLGLAWLTKGIDPHRHTFLSNIIMAQWGEDYPLAMITGPSFAAEVARFLPTALTVASQHLNFQLQLCHILHHENLRVYRSSDLIGVQLCGAVKNILAIACGISDGLEYGSNAKAALITRGLAEMKRLGVALGAQEETFLGLAGVGDLVLTCTDNQSRNRRFGVYLGRGMKIPKAIKKIGQVVEGYYNAAQVCHLAKEAQIELPICNQVNDVLQARTTTEEAVLNLLKRSPRSE